MFMPWKTSIETSGGRTILSNEEALLFIVTTFYNIGVCYQIACSKGAKSVCAKRAENIYEIAWETMTSLPTSSRAELAPAVILLRASVANNLGAIYMETFQGDALLQCLNALELCAHDVGRAWPWTFANIFEWRDLWARHAAVA